MKKVMLVFGSCEFAIQVSEMNATVMAREMRMAFFILILRVNEQANEIASIHSRDTKHGEFESPATTMDVYHSRPLKKESGRDDSIAMIGARAWLLTMRNRFD
jgi:hypothetical protein